jgi:transglutaminase-like putative cysteine protease
MNYRVRHLTRYTYGERVLVSLNQICLQPRETPFQQRLDFKVTVEPRPSTWNTYTDYFGNQQSVFTLNQPHQVMTVSAESQLAVQDAPVIVPAASLPWDRLRDQLPRPQDAASLEAYQYVFASPFVPVGPDYADYARPSFPAGRPVQEGLLDFTRRMHREFVYDSRATHLGTPVAEVLRNRRGVCQDFAQVQAACLRSLGLAARYVSGYLRTHPPPGRARLVGADASHAWISVWTGPDGWFDLDPTNGVAAGTDHLPIAWGRDYFDVTPVRGVILGGGNQGITVSVDVEPMEENEAELT